MENNGPGKLSELIGDNFIPPSSTPPLNPDPAQSASLPASAPLPSAPLNQARSWAMWCHLSALAGLVVPLGNILGPLIVWQMKRNEFPSVDAHGKAALNFQLSALIYLFGGSIAMVMGFIFCIGWLLAPVLLVVYFGSIILAVIAGIKANDGVPYDYPLTLKLVK